ncbi:Reticulocyte-binding protein 2 a [Madurella mycetomatis]|uniref:Reticulocyte-binding protein 2 a n=1 Tax=Madurella mycetomatis TaxID=100816 RepID=A0A175VQ99_9PEZI|nr:Reticulocyte-binding protein 2 a [Madurella mycetomatis]
MADTYWDPGNLLQITESDNASEIQCVGRARSRHGARCRWTLCGPDATAILRKVRELAVSHPSKATQRDLENLAKICLCHDYHSSQWFEVAQRWKHVVTKAVKHHERISKEHNGPATLECLGHMSKLAVVEFDLKNLQKELSSVQTDLSASEEQRRAVEEELEHAKLRGSTLAQEHVDSVNRLHESCEAERTRLAESLSELAKAEAQASSLRQEVGMAHCLLDEEKTKRTALEETVKEMERRARERAEELAEARHLLEEERKSMAEKVALELDERDRLLAEEKTKTMELEEATQRLEHRLSEVTVQTERVLDEERAKTHLLEEAKETLRRRLLEAEASSAHSAAEADRANRDNQALLRDNAAAAENLSRLQTDLVGIRAEIQRRTDHGSVLGRELQIARVDNQSLRSTHSQLTARNTVLTEQIAALEASLAKCWRRRLRAWLQKTSPLSIHAPSIQTQPSPVHQHPNRLPSSSNPPSLTSPKATLANFTPENKQIQRHHRIHYADNPPPTLYNQPQTCPAA